MTILLLLKYQSKLYNYVLARNIRIKAKAPVKLTGAPLLGLAKSILSHDCNERLIAVCWKIQ